MDWEILAHMHRLAGRAGVSWSLHYGEASDSWWVEISSAAPSECWVGKGSAFATAVTNAEDWLLSIVPVERGDSTDDKR